MKQSYYVLKQIVATNNSNQKFSCVYNGSKSKNTGLRVC